MSEKSYTFKITLKNKLGLHARPASIFVEEAKKYKSNIYITKNGKKVDGKSIIGVLSLGAEYGDEIEITCEGVDADAAANMLKKLIEKFPEVETQ
ncbi:MAG: HPr family phosphocarrier protein [Nitrososphaeria archaeon]